MVIIIEGLDRTGKTTLANKISERYNIPIYKKDREDFPFVTLRDNELINLGDSIATVKLFNSDVFKGKNVILDRFHWSEYVFNVIDRGGYLRTEYVDIVSREINKNANNYFIIHMHPTDIKRSAKEDGRPISLFSRYYDKFCFIQKRSEKMYPNIRVYNTYYGGIDKTCDMIGDLIKMEESV